MAIINCYTEWAKCSVSRLHQHSSQFINVKPFWKVRNNNFNPKLTKYFKVNLLLSYFAERLLIRELDFSALAEQNKNYLVEMIIKNEAKSEISMGFFQLTSRLFRVFNGVVVGFGPKGFSGRMCDSVY